jgi:hypothetical protein
VQKIIVTAAVLLIATLCRGQTKQISIPMYGMSDTTLWYKWQQKSFEQIGLPNLATSKDSLHFRFSTETQAVDIWTADYKTFYGTFSNFTTSEDNDKHPKPSKFYSNKTSLDTAISRKIYDIFRELSIFEIPTDASIKGWFPGNDGDEYVIEYSTPAKYSFKTYWTPSEYKDKIKEAELIYNLATRLEVVLEMRKSFGTFINTLPLGCYHSGSMFIMCTSKHKKKK